MKKGQTFSRISKVLEAAHGFEIISDAGSSLTIVGPRGNKFFRTKIHFQHMMDIGYYVPHYTFSSKGLSEDQIAFLLKCEEKWFAGEDISFSFLKEAANGFEMNSILMDAWNYWSQSIFPIYRDSIKNPMPLSELLQDGKYIGKDAGMNLSEDFYPEVVHDKLYLKYQKIIGSRLIAYVHS